MLEMLPNAQQWERGPKITAAGPGCPPCSGV